MGDDDRILHNALSIGVATGVYAVSFGVLAVAAGFSVAQTCVMSVFTFTGASQFTFVSVIAAGGGVAGALPPALLLAARNTVYALSLRGVIQGSLPRRALLVQAVVDEPTAMAHAQHSPEAKRRAFNLTALSLFIAWNAGTLGGTIRRPRARQPP
jgi:predicted branched-subunit amino acid permease